MKLLGALAAAQLAFMPAAGTLAISPPFYHLTLLSGSQIPHALASFDDFFPIGLGVGSSQNIYRLVHAGSLDKDACSKALHRCDLMLHKLM